jgi:hypothetical protein
MSAGIFKTKKTEADSAYQVVRLPACAGRFYPAEPEALRDELNRYLGAVKAAPGPLPKAVIAPHAGYIYSGPIAASAYARLGAGRAVFRRVILLGPSHYAEFHGLATSAADAFATPLGLVPLDKEAIDRARALPQVVVSEEAHRPEHSLEVHLPFLQTVLTDFALVPLLVCEADDAMVAEVLSVLWGGVETCLVVSSDLSHYHGYRTARQLDQATAQAIESLRGEGLGGHQACGYQPIRGLLRAARQHELRCQNIDLRSSGDTAGSRDQVVGYGAFVLG